MIQLFNMHNLGAIGRISLLFSIFQCSMVGLPLLLLTICVCAAGSSNISTVVILPKEEKILSTYITPVEYVTADIGCKKRNGQVADLTNVNILQNARMLTDLQSKISRAYLLLWTRNSNATATTCQYVNMTNINTTNFSFTFGTTPCSQSMTFVCISDAFLSKGITYMNSQYAFTKVKVRDGDHVTIICQQLFKNSQLAVVNSDAEKNFLISEIMKLEQTSNVGNQTYFISKYSSTSNYSSVERSPGYPKQCAAINSTTLVEHDCNELTQILCKLNLPAQTTSATTTTAGSTKSTARPSSNNSTTGSSTSTASILKSLASTFVATTLLTALIVLL